MAAARILLALVAAAALAAPAVAGPPWTGRVVGLQRLLQSVHTTIWNSLNYELVVKTDTEWDAMTTADFRQFNAVALMDNHCQAGPAIPTFLLTSAAKWGAAMTGNIVIIGTDEKFHDGQGGRQASLAFAAFVVADATKTGGYISLSCYYDSVALGTPVPFLNAAFPNMTGNFTVRGVGCYNFVEIVADSPALGSVTESNLAGWSCSVHEAFQAWPEEFEVLAIAEGIGASFESASGVIGTPYIIATGVRAISDIILEPATQNHEPGELANLRATVTLDGIPATGITVTFTATTGPHAGVLGSVVLSDYPTGVIDFSYVGRATGRDFIQAELIRANGTRAQRSNKVSVDWEGIIESGVCGRLGKRNVIVRGTDPRVVGRPCECRLDHCFQCRFFFTGRNLTMSPTPICQRCERTYPRLGDGCLEECPPGYTGILKVRPNVHHDMRRGRECVRITTPGSTPGSGPVPTAPAHFHPTQEP